jgi:hypothetical protein
MCGVAFTACVVFSFSCSLLKLLNIVTACRHHYDFLMESAMNAMQATTPPSSKDASDKVLL